VYQATTKDNSPRAHGKIFKVSRKNQKDRRGARRARKDRRCKKLIFYVQIPAAAGEIKRAPHQQSAGLYKTWKSDYQLN
jgi:hypothetical protein